MADFESIRINPFNFVLKGRGHIIILLFSASFHVFELNLLLKNINITKGITFFNLREILQLSEYLVRVFEL